MKISKNYNVDLSHILGSKTGYTDEAGLCMSSIANYNDVNYLLVTAGADYRGNIPRQLLDAINIYDYVSKIYSYKNLIDVDDYITTIDVKYSKTKKYDIKSNTTITKFLDNSFNNKKLTYNYKGIKEISYKNNVGEKLGTVDIIYDDKIMDTIDVFLNETIKFDLLSFLIQSKYIYLLIVGFITILLILITIIRIKLKKAK